MIVWQKQRGKCHENTKGYCTDTDERHVADGLCGKRRKRRDDRGHGCGSRRVGSRRKQCCIPGSSNEQHIIEDYDVWDFELTEEEMAQLTALDKNDRFADY